jgi:signal peptidase I
VEIDLPLVLTLAVLASGIVWALDRFAWRPRRAEAGQAWLAAHPSADEDDPAYRELVRDPAIVEYLGSFFPVLLIVLVLRSFVAEPFQIPSGSMLPTLRQGDFIVVSKYAYGLRLPVLNTRIVPVGEPERGDVMVFVPPHVDRYFIKRVVGLPGDTVRYANKRLYINGELVEQTYVDRETAEGRVVRRFDEALGDDGVHPIYQVLRPPRAPREWQVPEGHYFMMGDNRDMSDDSRFWGFVPEDQIVGRAEYIWLHWPSWGSVPTFSRAGPIH